MNIISVMNVVQILLLVVAIAIALFIVGYAICEARLIRKIAVGQLWERKMSDNPFDKRTDIVKVEAKLDGWVAIRHESILDMNDRLLKDYMPCKRFIQKYNFKE